MINRGWKEGRQEEGWLYADCVFTVQGKLLHCKPRNNITHQFIHKLNHHFVSTGKLGQADD